MVPPCEHEDTREDLRLRRTNPQSVAPCVDVGHDRERAGSPGAPARVNEGEARGRPKGAQALSMGGLEFGTRSLDLAPKRGYDAPHDRVDAHSSSIQVPAGVASTSRDRAFLGALKLDPQRVHDSASGATATPNET